MTEFRRLKMKIGEAEFEADVLENEVQPMYFQFLSMLERRSQAPARHGVSFGADLPRPDVKIQSAEPRVFEAPSLTFHAEALDRTALARVFDLRDDGAVILK